MREAGVVASVGSRGDCDNALAESFNGLFKTDHSDALIYPRKLFENQTLYQEVVTHTSVRIAIRRSRSDDRKSELSNCLAQLLVLGL
jgi:hypothetical protein